MGKNLKLSPPWVKFAKEIEMLFSKDPEVRVTYDEDAVEVTLYVENEEKAEAISKLLPSTKTFVEVELKITVLPANILQQNNASLFVKAFDGNPVLSYTLVKEGYFSNPMTYIVFAKEVVQFFNDDLGDVYGNCSTLYQDIAKDVFGSVDGIFFCTDDE